MEGWGRTTAPNGGYLTLTAPSGGLPNATATGRGSLLSEVEAIEVHDLVPGRNEVVD